MILPSSAAKYACHFVLLLSLGFLSAAALAMENKAGVPELPPDPPHELAMVINFGYGQGPQETMDPEIFEKMIVNIKKAGYNTIYCVYKDWRLEICRKHEVKMMIDLLAWHEGAETDIRREEQQAEVRRICEKVKGDKAVWGYNIWNERLDRFAPGGIEAMNGFLAKIRTWDSTHPVWVGTYFGYFLDRVEGTAGCLAFYDYHWSRGLGLNYNTLTACHKLCSTRFDYFGRWIHVNPDIRKSLYTINTTIAHGGKTIIWFINGAVDPKTGELNENHEHIKVHREIQKMYVEIAEMDKPVAVYSTPTTKTMDNQPKEIGQPGPIKAFPADHWAQVESGEAIVGFFKHDTGWDVLYTANNNALAPQKMKLRIRPLAGKQPSVEMFDRYNGGWKKIPVAKNTISFDLQPGGGEMLRLVGVDSE